MQSSKTAAWRAGFHIVFASVLTSVAPRAANAFPEMTRYGYSNCTTCHASPTGGGVLTRYGRQMSRELLSVWGGEGEEAFAYGLVPSPEWLDAQGMIRGVAVRRRTSVAADDRVIFMQGDLEAAARFDRYTLDATIGYRNVGDEVSTADHLISRRHYLIAQLTDQATVRLGRFFPSFGINEPDHIISTRRGLQINDEGTESYNLEAAWIDENFNFYATAIAGRPDFSALRRDTGLSLTASRNVFETTKLGVSYYRGSNDDRRRDLTSLWSVVGFTKELFLLAELDFQYVVPSATYIQNYRGIADFTRLGYAIRRGIIPYLQQELTRKDFNDSLSTVETYAAGVQFFPRPHIQIDVSWQRQRYAAISSSFGDYVYAMGNFYF